MKKMLGICLSLLVTFTANAFDNRFDTMVIFGDSMSDNGNLYRYMLHLLPASPPYFKGRFSNGPLWVEYLYDSYFPSDYQTGFQDYAVGGAGAVLSRKENLPFTLTVEVDDYFYWNTYGHKETSLFSIWIGGNNYLNEPQNVEELTDGVVNAIGGVVERLIAKGGNKFLLANLPDMAQMPQAKDSSNQWLLTYLTVTHNRKLAERIDALKIKYPDCVFIYFDAFSFFNESIERAEEFGFTNVSEPCYLGSYSGWLVALNPDDAVLHKNLKQQSPALTEKQWLMIKENPELRETAVTGYLYSLLTKAKKNEPLQCEKYVFWDKVHPTTAVHKLIAEQIKLKIGEAGLIPVLPAAFD